MNANVSFEGVIMTAISQMAALRLTFSWMIASRMARDKMVVFELMNGCFLLFY